MACADINCANVPAAEAGQGSGRVYDETFVRHWDTWATQGTRSRIFVMPLVDGRPQGRGHAGVAGPRRRFAVQAVRRRRGAGLEPGRPDALFHLRQGGRTEPNSTNLDIYAAAAEGGAPTNLTQANQATDTGPAVSPDGALARLYARWRGAAYEADRLVIQLRNLRTGETRALTRSGTVRSARIAWAPDGRSLLRHRRRHARHALVPGRCAQRPGHAADRRRHGRQRHAARRRLDRLHAQHACRPPTISIAATGAGASRGSPRSMPNCSPSSIRSASAASASPARAATGSGARSSGRATFEGRLAGRFADPWRPARFVRQWLVLSLEPAPLLGAGLCRGDDRFPRQHRLRPGLHRRDQPRLGRRAARGSAARPGRRGARGCADRREQRLRARRLLWRLHGELDRRQLARRLPLPGQPFGRLRSARHGL